MAYAYFEVPEYEVAKNPSGVWTRQVKTYHKFYFFVAEFEGENEANHTCGPDCPCWNLSPNLEPFRQEGGDKPAKGGNKVVGKVLGRLREKRCR